MNMYIDFNFFSVADLRNIPVITRNRCFDMTIFNSLSAMPFINRDTLKTA